MRVVKQSRFRIAGVVLLMLGAACLAVFAASRQIAYLPIGTSLIGAGVVFAAAARRRRC